MLQLTAVTKEYQHRNRGVKALDNVSLHILPGEFVSVVGSSGSGKSTLLLMLGGMLTPSSGSVLLDGQSLYDLSPDQRAVVRRTKIGFVFQTFNLVPYLSALENVEIPLFLAGSDVHLQKDKAMSMLERVGLADRIDHKPAELSVGQQQRVALARTLVNDPTIILADEPTGSLDPETSEQVLGFFEEMTGEGRTIVMVTHDPDAARMAERTLKLADGRLIPESNSIPANRVNNAIAAGSRMIAK